MRARPPHARAPPARRRAARLPLVEPPRRRHRDRRRRAGPRRRFRVGRVPPPQIPVTRRTRKSEGTMRRAGRLLTPANVIACIALFVALGGTGWAGEVIGRNAVGTTQL